MTRSRKLHKATLCVSAGLLASALTVSVAQARTLTFASVYPAGSVTDQGVNAWAEKLAEASGGELTARVFPMSLLSASESSAGIRDGLADVGYLLTAYYPSEYPHINMVNESLMQINLYDEDRLNGLGTYALEGAFTEFMFFNCPECQNELEAQNHVYTGNVSSSSYVMACTDPVISSDDVEGMRMRVAGSHWSRWVTEFGGSSVSLTVNEVREGLDQGIIDCTLSSLPDVLDLSLTEVVTDVTLSLPGGIYAGAGGANMNADVWKSLSEEHRTAVLKASNDLTARIPWLYEARADEALAAVRADGGEIHEPSEEFREATNAFIRNDMETAVKYYQERYGVERGEEMLNEFSALLDKWVDLVQGVETLDDLTQLYWDEIFSKVDVSTYGV